MDSASEWLRSCLQAEGSLPAPFLEKFIATAVTKAADNAALLALLTESDFSHLPETAAVRLALRVLNASPWPGAKLNTGTKTQEADARALPAALQDVQTITFTGSTLTRIDNLSQLKNKTAPRWVLPVMGSQLLVVQCKRGRVSNELGWVSYDEVERLTSAETVADHAVLLGVDSDAHGEVVRMAMPVHDPSAFTNDLRVFTSSRALLDSLSRSDAAIMAQAMAMLAWHRTHKYCGACGARTETVSQGLKRKCTNSSPPLKKAKSVAGPSRGVCGRTLYPRTDPVVIMSIESPCGHRLLLGRKPTHPKGIYTCLAGFMSPGESVEEACARETKEESGVLVDLSSIQYFASQPWPWGGQLMIAVHGKATTSHIDAVDDEMESVCWFDAVDVQTMLEASCTPSSFTGRTDMRTPPPMAIAHKLIAAWLQRKGRVMRAPRL